MGAGKVLKMQNMKMQDMTLNGPRVRVSSGSSQFSGSRVIEFTRFLCRRCLTLTFDPMTLKVIGVKWSGY